MLSIWLVGMHSIGVSRARPLRLTTFEHIVHLHHNTRVFPHIGRGYYIKFARSHYPIKTKSEFLTWKRIVIVILIEKKLFQGSYNLNKNIFQNTSTNCRVGNKISKLSWAFSTMILNRQSACKIVGPSSLLEQWAAKSSPSTIIADPTNHVANSSHSKQPKSNKNRRRESKKTISQLKCSCKTRCNYNAAPHTIAKCIGINLFNDFG